MEPVRRTDLNLFQKAPDSLKDKEKNADLPACPILARRVQQLLQSRQGQPNFKYPDPVKSTIPKEYYANRQGCPPSEKLRLGDEHSDMTITCGGKTYKAHKEIVCPRTKFFDRALNGNFKEAETGVVDLPEDDAFVLEKFLEFLYTGNYSDGVKPTFGKPDKLSTLTNLEAERALKMPVGTISFAEYTHLFDDKKEEKSEFPFVPENITMDLGYIWDHFEEEDVEPQPLKVDTSIKEPSAEDKKELKTPAREGGFAIGYPIGYGVWDKAIETPKDRKDRGPQEELTDVNMIDIDDEDEAPEDDGPEVDEEELEDLELDDDEVRDVTFAADGVDQTLVADTIAYLAGRRDDTVLHLQVYVMADKYDIPQLRLLARERFYRAAEMSWQYDDQFGEIIKEVYTTTAPHDRSIREIVARLVGHAIWTDKAMMEQMEPVMLEVPEFAVDVQKYQQFMDREPDEQE